MQVTQVQFHEANDGSEAEDAKVLELLELVRSRLRGDDVRARFAEVVLALEAGDDFFRAAESEGVAAEVGFEIQFDVSLAFDVRKEVFDVELLEGREVSRWSFGNEDDRTLSPPSVSVAIKLAEPMITRRKLANKRIMILE